MRRGVLLAFVLLGCSFESAEAAEGADSMLGQSTTSTDPSTTGSSTGAQAGDTSSTTTASSGDEPTTVQPDPSTSSPTSSGSYDPPSSSGGESESLSNEGLVARYYLDEADGGISPPFALDSADDPVHLPLAYLDRTMHYASAFGHRGLAFDVAGSDDGARAPIAETKFQGIEGVTALTFEVVVRLDDSINAASRLVHFGDNSSGVAALSSRNADQLQFAWNDRIVREWDYSAFNDGVAHVVHVIADTTAVNADLRVRLLVDGNELTASASQMVAPSEAASIPGDAIFALGNRDQDRAMQGILFYAAIYGVALADATIATHVVALAEDDDSPE